MAIYIIKLRIPSENRTQGYEDLDHYTAKIRYSLPAPLRQKLASLRSGYSQKFKELVVKFEDGIYIGTDEHLQNVLRLKEEIDSKLKTLVDDTLGDLQKKIEKIENDPKLTDDKKTEKIKKIKEMMEEVEKSRKTIESEKFRATVKSLPLNDEQIRRGEYYAAVAYAIYTTIIEHVLRRISKIQKKKLGDSEKERILDMLDRIQSLNFLDDEMVNRRIEELKRQIHGNIEWLKDMLTRELEELEKRRSSMFAYIEV